MSRREVSGGYSRSVKDSRLAPATRARKSEPIFSGGHGIRTHEEPAPLAIFETVTRASRPTAQAQVSGGVFNLSARRIPQRALRVPHLR